CASPGIVGKYSHIETRDVNSISTTKKTAGRPRSVSRSGTTRTSSVRGKIAAQMNAVQVQRRKATTAGQKRVEREVIVHPPIDVTSEDVHPGRTRNNPIVYEAIDLLRTYGYIPVRLSEPAIPINIIGMKKSGSLLVLALRSRLPVPSAAKLRELYTGKVDFLRDMAGKVVDRIMIWVYSPACGWRYYLVYPGGLRYDLDFPRSLE
ncbi:MAG: hypothetical protein LUQ71_07700, partial [Methanoregula sp.]|nr:hypothetical protein [Methanoregula sp.]